MTNANKRKGSDYERLLVDHFRNSDFDTERQREAGKGSSKDKEGSGDEGDLSVRLTGFRVVGEAKSGKNVRPRYWYEEEAVPEAKNYAKKRRVKERVIPAVFMKSHNKAVGKSLVTISLDDFTYLLQVGGKND